MEHERRWEIGLRSLGSGMKMNMTISHKEDNRGEVNDGKDSALA